MTTHSTRSRSSSGESFSLVKPKWTRYSIDEDSGESCGGLTPCGSEPPASASRSVTTWRCRYGSPPRSKMTRIADRPWLDVERTVRTFSVPASRPSSGRVTSASTCVASRPGVSVCTSTCGGAKSGNTSKRAPISAAAPSTAISTLSAVTMRGCASDERTIAASIIFRLARLRERPAAGRVREAFALRWSGEPRLPSPQPSPASGRGGTARRASVRERQSSSSSGIAPIPSSDQRTPLPRTTTRSSSSSPSTSQPSPLCISNVTFLRTYCVLSSPAFALSS